MTINKKIIQALSPFGYPISAGVFLDDKPIYFAFFYNTVGTMDGDNAPLLEKYLVSVQLITPIKFNPISVIRRVKSALFGAGFSFPSMSSYADGDNQQYVFECEICLGVDTDS